ncbi:MAG: 50S ribosomal protein L35 [Polyangiaceae bacterium]
MPKMKTNRAAAKRFRKTGSGKIRRAKAGLSHGMFNKNRKHCRRLRKNGMVHKSMVKRIKVLLPYA